ncbi:MAG: sulfatase [Gammaproteobacteria bacterium]|nr:sulfatase [Gammaproteobacteria bacterium]
MQRLITLFTSLALLSLLVTSQEGKASDQAASLPEQPNFLFIMVDDLNDYLGTFGGHPQAHTPNIDQLAASGMQFSNAHTNVPLCSPARSSLFTGVYPHVSRDFGWTRLEKQATLKHNRTFLELFRDSGYQMLGTGKLLHNNSKEYWDEWGVPTRINYGPHAWDGNKIVGHPNVPEPFRNINVVDGSFAPLSDVPQFDNSGPVKHTPGWGYPSGTFHYVSEDDRDRLPDEQHATWAAEHIAQLDQSDDSKPFFLGVGFVRPHTPLYAPKRFFDMFPLDEIQLSEILPGDADDTGFKANYPESQMGLRYYQALMESYENDEEGLKKIIQAYLACIAFVDEQVGIVIDSLDRSGLRDNTIVVFTSDHGWNFGEKDYLYKNSPWEESTRIPLLVRVPGYTVPGSSSDQPVSLVDLFPTLRELARLNGEPRKSAEAGDIGGHSLVPLLRDETINSWEGPDGVLTVMGAGINEPIEGLAVRFNPQAPWHIRVLQALPDSYVWQQTYSWRTRNWRYIRYPGGQEELYDHRNDPYEWHNLANQTDHIGIKSHLKQQMVDMIDLPLTETE